MTDEVQEVQERRKSGVFLLPTQKPAAEHELAAHRVLGIKIAELLSTRFAGTWSDKHQLTLFPYLIPNDTLSGADYVRALRIKSEHDFFGGVVAQPFMATKAITHPLVKTDAYAPTGWSARFSKKILGSVLKGFTAFTLSDAQLAGIRLLADGPVRIKPVRACAGKGQLVINNRDELAAVIATLDENEIGSWGLVLEENLNETTTFSVGQITLAGQTVSYVGIQHLTRDNHGETVYGGSTLDVVRGDYTQLGLLKLSEKEQLVISQARKYEEAAFACFPDLMLSRRNYDIAQGLNASGDFCSGVLEQSWRIGGASGAEIFALDAFAKDNALQFLRASVHEIYGTAAPPAHTAILYRGEDPEVGHITKYVKVESYVYAN